MHPDFYFQTDSIHIYQQDLQNSYCLDELIHLAVGNPTMFM